MASRAGQQRAKAKAAEEEGISLTATVDGKVYKVAAKDLTAIDVREMRKQLGFSFMGLLRELQTDSDLDLIAGVVWIARRSQGERGLTYAEVAENMDYEDLEVAVVKQDSDPDVVSIGEDDSPEA